jgi:hypothetical protein
LKNCKNSFFVIPHHAKRRIRPSRQWTDSPSGELGNLMQNPLKINKVWILVFIFMGMTFLRENDNKKYVFQQSQQIIYKKQVSQVSIRYQYLDLFF